MNKVSKYKILPLILAFSSIFVHSLFAQMEWVCSTLAAEWTPRAGHSSVFFDNKIWVIGGNDVWYSIDGVNWNCATDSAGWLSREGHTSVVFDNKIWVLGGYNGSFKNDVWYSSNGINWVQATASAQWSGRYRHTSVVFDNKIWVLGGHPGQSSNDVWYSTDGVNWTQATASAGWSARSAFTSVVFDNKIWVLGGYDVVHGTNNNVWSSTDGVNWTQATASAGWSARRHHTSVVFDNKMWILGGVSFPNYYNDVWYSTDGVNWTQATASAGWSARYGHTSVVFDNKMLVLGGAYRWTIPTYYNDVWYSRGLVILTDLELLPMNATASPPYLYLSNISVLWGTNYTEEYPWTDKEFIGAVVRNTSSIPVNDVLVRFYVDGIPIGDTTITTMTPGETCVVDRIWDLSEPVTENKLVEVRIDPDNTIPESDEDNNAASESVSIYYSKRTQNPIRQYDLRTDAYGKFKNFSWNSYDALWISFGTFVLNPFPWTNLENVMLRVLFPLYAVVSLPGGHCYGMAATSIHYFDYPSMIPNPYERTFDLPQEVAQDNINYYHLTSFFDVLYRAFLYWLTNPSQEYTNLYQFFRNQQEPVMILAEKNDANHATSCYKIIERGAKKLTYIYDNDEWYGPGNVTIPAFLSAFDLDNNTFFGNAKEFLNYNTFARRPDIYLFGFPYMFNDLAEQKVLVRRPRLEVGDWARDLLHDIWEKYFAKQFTEGMHLLTIACPVEGLITDNYGRRVGFVGNSLINEIPGATIDTGFTVEIYKLPDSLMYNVSTAAYDTGKMSISFVMPLDTALVRVVTFDTIPMLSTTQTEFSFSRTDTIFQMSVDWDSNGVPDTILNPNFNDTIGVPQVAVEERQLSPKLPPKFALNENIPNPFKSQTIIRYSLPKEGNVSLQVYDISGRLVRNLVNEKKSAGVYAARWDGEDNNGTKVPFGVYFYRLEAGEFSATKKMVKME